MRSIYLAIVIGTVPAASLAQGLYREDTFRPLTADHRAYRLGDALTVLVFENSSATTTADTSTDKQGSVGITVVTPNHDKKANLALNEDFSGRGRVQRSGKLLAQLTVNVRAVAPNGDLIVAGSQLIEVNDERQHILLEGRVRPLDISETNTVPSSRLADARISYLGDGLLAEKQHPGLLTRVLSWLGIL